MATDDRQVQVAGQASAPARYVIPGNGQIRPKVIFARYDGTATTGAYQPAVKVTSDAGLTVGIFPASPAVTAGGSVNVSWFPGVDEDDGTSTSAGGGGTISTLNSPLGSLSISSPAGPTTSADIAASGVTPGSYGDSLTVPQVTVDNFGRLTGVSNVAIASGAGGGIVQVSKVTVTSGDQTTNGTNFADASGTTTTITTGAHRCLVIFTANAHVSGGAGNAAFDLAIDGSRQGGAYGLSIVQQAGGGAQPNVPVGFVYLTSVLTAAAHTFKIQWRVDGAITGTMFASASVTPAILTVLELGV